MPPRLDSPAGGSCVALRSELGSVWHRDSLGAASREPVMGVEVPRGAETEGDIAEPDLLSLFALLQIT